jgi:hypothetical protein
MTAHEVEQEEDAVKWILEYLNGEGKGNALVMAPQGQQFYQRVRAFVLCKQPNVNTITVRPLRACNLAKGERLVHLTTMIPERIDREKCDQAVIYMPKMWRSGMLSAARQVLNIPEVVIL